MGTCGRDVLGPQEIIIGPRLSLPSFSCPFKGREREPDDKKIYEPGMSLFPCRPVHYLLLSRLVGSGRDVNDVQPREPLPHWSRDLDQWPSAKSSWQMGLAEEYFCRPSVGRDLSADRPTEKRKITVGQELFGQQYFLSFCGFLFPQGKGREVFSSAAGIDGQGKASIQHQLMKSLPTGNFWTGA